MAPDRFLWAIIDASVSERFLDLKCKARLLYGGQALSGKLRVLLATYRKRTNYQNDLTQKRS